MNLEQVLSSALAPLISIKSNFTCGSFLNIDGYPRNFCFEVDADYRLMKSLSMSIGVVLIENL